MSYHRWVIMLKAGKRWFPVSHFFIRDTSFFLLNNAVPGFDVSQQNKTKGNVYYNLSKFVWYFCSVGTELIILCLLWGFSRRKENGPVHPGDLASNAQTPTHLKEANRVRLHTYIYLRSIYIYTGTGDAMYMSSKVSRGGMQGGGCWEALGRRSPHPLSLRLHMKKLAIKIDAYCHAAPATAGRRWHIRCPNDDANNAKTRAENGRRQHDPTRRRPYCRSLTLRLLVNAWKQGNIVVVFLSPYEM